MYGWPDQAKEARQEREAQVAKAQMEAALSRGVSWGMAEDARASDDDEVTHHRIIHQPAAAAAQVCTCRAHEHARVLTCHLRRAHAEGK